MAESASILNDHQKRIFEALILERYFTDRYYLTGGTALAEFYLKHRFSEDFDFFSETEEVDPVAIARFWNTKGPALGLVKVEPKRAFGLYQYFLHFKDRQVVLVDFSFYPFPRIEKKKKIGDLEVDSILDIAVNKIHTVTMRQKARDYIDIFCIVREKGYDIRDLIFKAKAKFDWHINAIELGARLREARHMTDFPRMIKPIDPKEWQDFFVHEASKLKDDIFE